MQFKKFDIPYVPVKGQSRPKNGTLMASKELEKAQAALIVAEKLGGATNGELAAKYRMNPDTIRRRLRLAEQEGLHLEAVDRVFKELVPEALATYKQALAERDLSAARDVMFGTNIFRKGGKAESSELGSGEELTLEAWRIKRTRGSDSLAAGNQEDAPHAGAGTICDATFTEVGEEVGPERGEAGVEDHEESAADSGGERIPTR